jgi:3-methyl-2-oxobutanoate hydroxymethyltransferase
MPFGSYQESPEQAFRNAAHIMKETACQAVKLEGGVEMADTVAFMAQRGIPVLGHIGLKPQSINAMGAYRMTGKTKAEEVLLRKDAQALEQAGAFGLVLECVKPEIAADISRKAKILTIGIGASVACDGQVLVTEDLLGIHTGYIPRFVKQYATLSKSIDKAIKSYSEDVRKRRFPEV